MPVHLSRETFSHLNYSFAVHSQRTNSYLVSLNSAGHTTEANKGKPGDAGKSKAGIKTVDIENQEQEEMLNERYTKDDGTPDPDQVYITNRNRNTNKPDIDKPAYGGS